MARDFSKHFGAVIYGQASIHAKIQAVHPASLPALFPDSLAVSIETGWISEQNMVTETHGRS